MKNQLTPNPEVAKSAAEVAALLEQVISDTEKKIEERITPIRREVTKRFPTLFLLLSTFGLIATYLAMEQLLLQYNITQENPVLLLIIGVGILVFTGTLYKKLG